MHRYIVNVGNCINMSYYEMFFYEGISRRKADLYEIDTLEDLSQVCRKIKTHQNRDAFSDPDFSVVVCVARSFTPENFQQQTDLILKILVYEEILRKLSCPKVSLVVLDRLRKGREDYGKFRDWNRQLSEKGYLHEKSKLYPCEEDLGNGVSPARVLARCQAVKKKLADSPGRGFFSDVLDQVVQIVDHEAEKGSDQEKDGAGLSFNLQGSYSAKYRDHGKNTIDCVGLINDCIEEMNLTDEISVTLKAVRYILREESDFTPEDYSSFGFDVKQEGNRLATCLTRMKRLNFDEMERERPDLELTYVYNEELLCREGEELPKLQLPEEDLLPLSGIYRSPGEFAQVISKIKHNIHNGEALLEEFAENISARYRDQKPELRRLPTESAGTEKKRLLEEKDQLVRGLYQFTEASGDQAGQDIRLLSRVNWYNDRIIDILKRLERCKWLKFLPVLIIAWVAVALPYAGVQSYLFSEGEPTWIFFVYVAAVALLFGASFYAAKHWMKRKMARLSKEMKGELDSYFQGLSHRGDRFADRLESIRKLRNINGQLAGIEKGTRELEQRDMALRWHCRQVQRHMDGLRHFSDLIDISKAQAEDPVELNLNKGVADNPVYWPTVFKTGRERG